MAIKRMNNTKTRGPSTKIPLDNGVFISIKM